MKLGCRRPHTHLSPLVPVRTCTCPHTPVRHAPVPTRTRLHVHLSTRTCPHGPAHPCTRLHLHLSHTPVRVCTRPPDLAPGSPSRFPPAPKPLSSHLICLPVFTFRAPRRTKHPTSRTPTETVSLASNYRKTVSETPAERHSAQLKTRKTQGSLVWTEEPRLRTTRTSGETRIFPQGMWFFLRGTCRSSAGRAASGDRGKTGRADAATRSRREKRRRKRVRSRSSPRLSGRACELSRPN